MGNSLPTFNYDPSFSLDVTNQPNVEAIPLGDGFTDNIPIGLRPQLRIWDLQFLALRLNEIQPIVDFFEARGGWRSFRWTPPHPDRIPGIWLARRWSVNRPDGVIYNLSTTFEEQ